VVLNVGTKGDVSLGSGLDSDEISKTAKRVGFYIPLNSRVWTEGDEKLVFGKIISPAGVRKSQVRA